VGQAVTDAFVDHVAQLGMRAERRSNEIGDFGMAGGRGRG
jgi:hypothetical protein